MEMDAAVSFGEVLKELRTRKKLSRPRLAQALRMHPSSIEKWERGDVLPDRARVEDLIHALELSEAERLLLLEAHAGHRILPSVLNLPTQRNPYFTGRTEILAELHRRLAPGSQVALTQTAQAISGLGGIGKTQVALEYVYRYQRQHSHLLWVTADSRETLTTEFSKLARDLDLPEKNEKDQNKVVRAVQRWLREYLDWLLILDNIEDLGLVSEFVPTGYLGAVLLTTRRQVAEPVAQVLELDVFSEDEGAFFLLKRAKRLAPDEALDHATTSQVIIAQTITQQLDELPLALDQAGAYIAETGCGLSDYLGLFEQRRAALLDRRGTLPPDHPLSVTATFSLAFERVQQKSEAAIDLLTLCAYLAPDAIPMEVITEGAASLGIVLGPVANDPLQLDQALETLQAYSLVRRDGESRTLFIHRLVQAVLQETLEETERHTWAERTMLAVNAAFLHIKPGIWLQCERLLPHALLAAQYIKADEIVSEEAERLLYETGAYLRARARYAKAEPLYQQFLRIREKRLGLEHHRVAAPLNNLADLYQAQGKYAQAEPLYQRALSIYEQQSEPEHLDVAYPLNNLANLYSEQGKYIQAEPLYQRALLIREKQLGPEHPDVAISLNNLANLYSKQGKYIQAEPLYQRALSIWEHQLGSEHLEMANPLNNLAELFTLQGKYAEAEPLHQRARRIWERRLGPEHPNVAYSLNNLANLYVAQGKYTEAEPLYQQALQIHEQALEPQLLGTAEIMHSLARLREAQGNNEEAKTWYVRSLVVRGQTLGAHHPETTETRKRLIALLHAMGQHEEATQLEGSQSEQGMREEERKTHPEESEE